VIQHRKVEAEHEKTLPTVMSSVSGQGNKVLQGYRKEPTIEFQSQFKQKKDNPIFQALSNKIDAIDREISLIGGS